MAITFGGKVQAGGKLSFGSSTPASNQAGAGAGPSGTNIYDQSTAGNVAPFPTAPGAPTAIGSFPFSTSGAGNYQLTADCSLGGSTTCITNNNANTVIDFNGHTVNGRIICQFNCNGQEYYSSASGGTHTCSSKNSTAIGCLSIQDTGRANPLVKVHHLTTSNTVDASGAEAAYYGFVDWGTPTGSLTLQLYNLTSSMSNVGDVNTTRVTNWRVQGAENIALDFHHNNVVCGATTPVCQGIEIFQPYGAVYNNYFHFPVNSLLGDSPRAVAWDGNYGTAQSGSLDVYNNYFSVPNGRSFRMRNRYGCRFHDNYVDAINTDTTIGSLHIGDPDSGDNLEMQFLAENNIFRVTGGNVLMSRSATGVTLGTNTVQCISGSCSGGRFAYVRTPLGTVSRVTIKNNPSVSGIGFTSENTVDASGTLLKCNSGTSDGAGTATTIACQP